MHCALCTYRPYSSNAIVINYTHSATFGKMSVSKHNLNVFSLLAHWLKRPFAVMAYPVYPLSTHIAQLFHYRILRKLHFRTVTRLQRTKAFQQIERYQSKRLTICIPLDFQLIYREFILAEGCCALRLTVSSRSVVKANVGGRLCSSKTIAATQLVHCTL